MIGLTLAGILMPAACALVTVLLLAFLVPDGDEVDQSLHRYFMVIFSVLMIAAFGFIRQPTVQQALDPEQKRAAELAAHPIYLALNDTHIDEPPAQNGVRRSLAARLADGEHSVPDAMTYVRPELQRVGNERLGFANNAERIAWGRVHLDTLKELSSNPIACQGVIVGNARGDVALRTAVSADNDREFQQVLVAMLRNGYDNMGSSKPWPASERVELSDVQRRYGELREQWVTRYGQELVDSLPKSGHETVVTRGNEADVCAARMGQLRDVLAEPAPMAARLVDGLLR